MSVRKKIAMVIILAVVITGSGALVAPRKAEAVGILEAIIIGGSLTGIFSGLIGGKMISSSISEFSKQYQSAPQQVQYILVECYQPVACRTGRCYQKRQCLIPQ